jgi:soluble lytic murein transglycosylase-like protein
MKCESGGDPDAYNTSSGASGLMQHLDNYFPWRAKMAGYEGASPFDPIANINTSAWLLYEHVAGGWQHWVCQ